MHKDIIFKFVNAINKQQLALIIDLMSDDFIFIDTWGEQQNKEHMKTGWQGYFDWFPNYFIDITDYIENDEFAVIIGNASASYLGKEEKHWRLPAAWKVIVAENQIRLWQVFCDAKKQLDVME